MGVDAATDSASGDSVYVGSLRGWGLGSLRLGCGRIGLPAERIESIRAAFETAERAHEGQFRRSGDPYICHPLETALILTDIEMLDAPTLQAALLHDVVEDSPMTLDEMTEQFGEEIAGLVDGVTKLSRLAAQPQQGTGGEAASQPSQASVYQAESLRKMLARDGAGRPRRAHQAGGSFAQHADAGRAIAGSASSNIAGDARHLRAAGASAGHRQHRVRVE